MGIGPAPSEYSESKHPSITFDTRNPRSAAREAR